MAGTVFGNGNGFNHESDEEELEQQEHMEEWDDWRTDEDDSEPDFVCLFCDQKYSSVESVFEHCSSKHFFDFQSIKKTLGLNFYDSFKLINYIRSQVAENRCWSCRLALQSSNDLQKHLHEPISLEEMKLFLEDDKYLKPFIQEDSLLYNFWEDEDCEEDHTSFADRDEVMMELANNEDLGKIHFDDDDTMDMVSSKPSCMNENGSEEVSTESNGSLNMLKSLEKVKVSGIEAGEDIGSSRRNGKDKNLKVSFANVVAKERKNVNANYFGAYGSYGIHKEMISDKVRMDAYRGAILNNPSLLTNATVLDVGCGTGILSMFAAQAGAARVIAVEASDKMAAVATQIAKDNGLLWGGSPHSTGVINVVQGMVEEIDKSVQIPPHSVDILISEWMGYCLLYETMLSSVLYARDRWLKPGGAILPDTATIFVAGFGRGGTSIPFWENVYGFNMSCISKEVVEDASQNPIVDVLDSRDIMTNTAVLQTFDLATMKEDEMDFTSSFELEPKLDLSMNQSTDLKSKIAWCYGVILWFETGFTSRFCKENSTVLSTSPYDPKTHWSQTILTFREPIAMALEKPVTDNQAMIGTDAHPAVRIQSRISIVRAAEHRSIDISLETSGISSDGRTHNWPVQIFNL